MQGAGGRAWLELRESPHAACALGVLPSRVQPTVVSTVALPPRRQLEVFANSADGGAKGTLLAVLNHTQASCQATYCPGWPVIQPDCILVAGCYRRSPPASCPPFKQTPFGARLLRSWVGKPLRHRPSILARLDAVQELAEQGGCGRLSLQYFVRCPQCSTPLSLPDLQPLHNHRCRALRAGLQAAATPCCPSCRAR